MFAGLAVEAYRWSARSSLENSDDGTLRDDCFRDLLRSSSTVEDTEQQLDIATDWGRYGELFDYDADTGELVLSERVVHRRRQGLAGHIDQSPLTHTPRTQGGVISSTNGCSPLPPRWRGMGFAAQFGPILVR